MIKTLRIVLIPVLLFTGYGCQQLTGSQDSESAFSDTESGSAIAAADDNRLGKEQKTLYQRDAEILAVRYINEKDSTQTGIPESLINTLYNGLIHIVNADHPKAREATMAKYHIHAQNPASPRKILVLADTSASWIEAWRNERTETGYTDLDELISRFNFTLTQYRESAVSRTATATLRSDRAINVFAVSRLFTQLNDIENAYPNYKTDGSEIRVLFFDDFLRYTLEYGFGDCPGGCINRHIWKFNVYFNGSVEFAGESGEPLPEN